MGLTIFAQRLKQAREKKGLKQNELAKAVKVTPNTISAYEKSDTEGNGKKPTLENAQAIAENLEVSLDWLCGISDGVNASYTDFTADDYFKSLVTILMETSSKYDEQFNGIAFDNKFVPYFVKKVSDLINVYRAGSIPEDLFKVCIDKILNDYKYYTVYASCLLTNGEYYSAVSSVDNLLEQNYDVGPGVYTATISENPYEEERQVKLIITPEMVYGETDKANGGV